MPLTPHFETSTDGIGQVSQQGEISARENEKTICVYMLELWSFIPYYVAHLCTSLRAKGVKVTLGSVRYHLDRAYFSKVGLTPDRALLDCGGAIRFHPLRRFVKCFEYLANLMILALRFVLSRPDILHIQFLPFLERGLTFELWFVKQVRRLDVRVIYTVHNVTPQDTPDRHKTLYKRVYSMADGLICHGEEARIQLIRDFGIEEKRIWVVPHGPLFAEKPQVSLQVARKKLGFPVEEPLVLSLGVISKYKGISFLLDVWKLVINSGVKGRLVIAGTGDPALLSSISEKVSSEGLMSSVDLKLKFISIEELPLLHQAADILVYPYMAGTTSGALLTGMNYQKAIIATRLPFFLEHLQDGRDAVLVPYGDVDGWARALSNLLGDEERREQLGKSSGTAMLSEMSWSNIAHLTSKCYRAVCDNSLLSEVGGRKTLYQLDSNSQPDARKEKTRLL
jgi:glycosyltransferase involved in cell wall biosynthesis